MSVKIVSSILGIEAKGLKELLGVRIDRCILTCTLSYMGMNLKIAQRHLHYVRGSFCSRAVTIMLHLTPYIMSWSKV